MTSTHHGSSETRKDLLRSFSDTLAKSRDVRLDHDDLAFFHRCACDVLGGSDSPAAAHALKFLLEDIWPNRRVLVMVRKVAAQAHLVDIANSKRQIPVNLNRQEIHDKLTEWGFELDHGCQFRPLESDDGLLALIAVDTRGLDEQTQRLNRHLDQAVGLLGFKLEAQVSLEQLGLTLDDIRRAEKLQKALFEISELASMAENMADFLRAIHGIVGRLMPADNFFIAFYHRDRDAVSFPYFVDTMDAKLPIDGEELALEDLRQTGTAWVIHNGRTLAGDSEHIKRVLDVPGSIGSDSTYWMGAPLFADDAVVGAIVTQTYEDGPVFSEEDLDLLVFVSRHISNALQRKRARDELEAQVQKRTRALRLEVQERQHAEKLQSALFRITELTNSAESLEEFYESVHGIVSELIYAENFYIALSENDQRMIRFAYHVDEFDSRPQPRKAAKGLTEYVLKHGRPTLVDPEVYREMAASGDVTQRENMTTAYSWLGVPLNCSGDIVGVLAVQSYTADISYSARDQELLTFVSHHIATALERKRASDALRSAYGELEQRVVERTHALDKANERLRHENLHDALTELPNRSLFMTRLEEARKRHRQADGDSHFAVLFLDLDRFKIINDSLGHLAGDELLVEVGRRIRSCLREHDTIARLGGDEFAVLLEGLNKSEEAEISAQRIIDCFNKPFVVSSQEVFTSTSIGIALDDHHDYGSGEEILRDADAAMYRAKAQGRRNYAIFHESLHTQALSALAIENDLRRALSEREIKPFFQPILELSSGRLIGFEALARWQHPERGLISPAHFVPVAEETGLINRLDWLIFEQVCELTAAWFEEHEQCADMRMSVNFSSEHFRSIDFPERMMASIGRFGLRPSAINIEVTESAMIGNIQTVRAVFRDLREFGIRLSLDDFGTGYSSLSYLHRFPVDLLKIEKSFVNNMDKNHESYAIIQTVRALAKSIGISVIAEGIETERQYDLLKQLGCEYGQGFLMAKPMPAKDAKQYMLTHRLDSSLS